MRWFLQHRPMLAAHASRTHTRDGSEGRLLAIASPERLDRVLRRVLDETELVSPHGVRALSAMHRAQPFEVDLGGMRFAVDYEPGESTTGLFAGNSNWRGPVWFPVNYLVIEAVRRYARFFGDELSRRLVALFPRGRRRAPPCFGDVEH